MSIQSLGAMMAYSELAQGARMVFIGILLFVIAYQLWVAQIRRSEPVLYMVAAWATAALIVVVGRAVQHATSDPATVLLGSRVFHTGVLALVPLGFMLMHELRAAPRDALFRVMMVATSVPVVLVWTSDLIVSSETQQFQTLMGPIFGPAPAPFGPLALPYLAVLAAYLVYVARRGRRDLQWHQRLPLQASLLLLPAFVNDALLYAGSLVTTELASIGLFINVMAINVGIFARAGQLFSQLELDVDARTAELRAQEREVSRMLETQRRILDAIPDTVCLLDSSRVDYVNDAGVRFFGTSRADVSGSAFTDLVVEAQAADAERYLSSIAQASQPVSPVELRFRGPQTSELTGEVTGLMVGLDDGPRALVTIRDVTERKRLLAKLQMADRLASMGMLAAGVAHEVNNPMTFIVGNLELMRERVTATSRDPLTADPTIGFVQLIDDCLAGSKRIVRIVQDLNLFVRSDDESVVLEVPATVDQALKIARVTIRHRARVTTSYGAVPRVTAAAGQLAQVFLNLLMNASQAIPDDGGEHSIHVSTSTGADGSAVIEIADTGVGLDPALGTSVFDPFVTSKPAGTGMGLGLFICRGIVTALGGDLRLFPREPRGTTARVTLPAAHPMVVTEPTKAGAAAHPERSSRGDIGVLVADDEDMVLRLLQRQLHDYAVTAVASGFAAIEALESKAYDAVVCDLVMPGCNGIEVWKQAKELGYDGRFVLMTGGAPTEALRELLDRVPGPFLRKPFTSADLRAAVQAAVARSRGRRRTDPPA